ncbi:MAG: UTP--glucose-1-phosphate uridylyltransferase GalU [Pseudomonadota bacterium]
MRNKLTKAIFPVAGMGTRFLPATKSVPKEIMTLVDRPLVQYAIDEARAAGIKEFIFVTSRGKGALEDYFDNAPQLEQELRKKGKDDLLEILKSTNMDSGEIAYTRQNKPLGLGHAVWCARRLIANEPFAVILPDDVISSDTPCLAQMVDAFEETGSNIVAAMEVPDEQASSYGVLDIKEDKGQLVSTKGMVEKPAPGKAPSNLAVIGRYILTPTVLQKLNKKKTGAGGEIQLTDAIADARADGEEVYGFRFKGRRFDCGSKAGFLQATVAFALDRPELRDDLLGYLTDVVHPAKAAE